VFGHIRSCPRGLEDLAGLDAGDLGVGQIAFASRAALWPVGDHLVGVRYLRQVVAL